MECERNDDTLMQKLAFVHDSVLMIEELVTELQMVLFGTTSKPVCAREDDGTTNMESMITDINEDAAITVDMLRTIRRRLV